MQSTITFDTSLSAVLIHADGSQVDYGVISGSKPVTAMLTKPMSWYVKLWNVLKREGKIPAIMGLGAFIAYLLSDHHAVTTLLGITTVSGVDYIASDFASGSASPHIGALNFHDCGTGGATGSTKTISGATNASPIVVQTSTAHGYGTNDLITIASVGGNTNANGSWQISVVDSTHFNLIGSTGNSAYTSGGTSQVLNGQGDTALTTAAGTARVSGTQSNPSANIYKSLATISFTSSLAISEWAIFSASTSGTMLDRRYFNTFGAPATTATGSLTAAPINVVNADSIQFSYSLTVSAGGS